MSLALLAATLFSCQKQEAPVTDTAISDDVLAAIEKAGFSKEGVIREDGGYIVEGDIFIDDAHLRTQPHWGTLTIAQTEHYRTTNLVNGPRNITISVSSRLPSAYLAHVDAVVARYNAQNLTLTFSRVAANGNINLVPANGSFLASAGFPSGGNPFNEVKINSRSLNGQPANTIVSVIAHEIGHCIGFRHTDYMDRSYSCGGSTANEGASTVGAILIPGTPAGPDADSWMLACIGSGQNRPFTPNDVTALTTLY